MKKVNYIDPKTVFTAVIATVLTLGLSLSLQSIFAEWSAPTQNAPSGNTYKPIYATSSANQRLEFTGLNTGLQLVGTLAVADNASFAGNVNFNNSVTVQNNMEIAGSIKIGDDTATCDNAKDGTLRFNSSNKVQVCDGSSWNDLSGGGGGGGTTCTLPWGGTINDGQSTTAYQSSSVPCGSSCTPQTRVCNSGTLSGSYTNQSCSVTGCSSCTLPWGGTVAHGSNVTAYQSSSVPCGSSCASQTRSCSNGTLSGSYTNQSCSVAGCAACTLPWGTSIAHGASVLAYQTSSVACGYSCANEIRACSNGTLSGSYTNQSCSVTTCGGTTPYCSTSHTCVQCTADSHCGANATCSSNSCVCTIHYSNCDGSWGNGCETNIYSASHCGTCSATDCDSCNYFSGSYTCHHMH